MNTGRCLTTAGETTGRVCRLGWFSSCWPWVSGCWRGHWRCEMNDY
nr:MAG TPA: hypothetical protein [Caudoviricetes sp.]